MKIEVGMYVRTKNHNGFSGGIGKVERIAEDKTHKTKYLTLDRTLDRISFLVRLEEVKKMSFNITALIEEDDLVVIEYYVSKYRERISRIFEVTKDGNKLYFDNPHCAWSYDLLEHKFLQAKGYNPKIKSIVTHEQFENMKYEVE